MRKFFRGFYFAGRGICTAFQERNMRVHGIATILVLGLGLFFQITPQEWTMLFLAIGLVLMAEALNTACEYLVNLIRDDCHVPYENEKLGKAKDIAAGAVLLTAIAAASIGALIFLPYLLTMNR